MYMNDMFLFDTMHNTKKQKEDDKIMNCKENLKVKLEEETVARNENPVEIHLVMQDGGRVKVSAEFDIGARRELEQLLEFMSDVHIY